jgi:integrase
MGKKGTHRISCRTVDCEIDPTSRKGHGGRRNAPGAQIKSFYESWRAAVKNAGFPDLLFHDLRRSAVRNMVEKIGMSEKRAMEISGHTTRSYFERYHIVSLADIQESGQKMDKWMKAQRQTEFQEGEIRGTTVANRALTYEGGMSRTLAIVHLFAENSKRA